jgi:hypothetical protein
VIDHAAPVRRCRLKNRENSVKRSILAGILAALAVLTVVTVSGGAQVQSHQTRMVVGGFRGD